MPEDEYLGEPVGDDREPEHKGHWECPKCNTLYHAPGKCTKDGETLEEAD